ncbi:MAG: BatD family protein, partial [Candidatus Krumholzibacteria bacterium]|nr:BatD family protein [Candidatus Krumholzibacteria bacterium]
IEVTKPGETEEFKLRIRLSRETCYVGEPVTLDVIWYLRRDVQEFRFTAPLLESADFDFAAPEVQIDNSRRYYRIPIGGGEVIAEKGRGMLDGVTYATLTFKIAMISKSPGSFVIPEFVVACESATGRVSRRNFFDDFFRDDFFSLRRGKIKKYVVPSNRLSLLVRGLPTEGCPPGFAGHVGEYRIGASAEPAEVNIGDPITLTLTIEGPDYLEHINMPPLQNQALIARDFKIPEERADGAIQGKKKVFTQTIRARSEEIKEIPPIELVYFDSKEGRYRTARSKPIPIKVNPTRVVTASDAEGIEAAPLGTSIEQWREGISYNFEGSSVLEPQEYGILSVVTKPGWLAVILIPPVLYGILFSGVLFMRRRKSDPAAKRARGAFKRLHRRLGAAAARADFQEPALEALRDYLGDKMDRTGATITALDIERVFGERSVPDELTGTLLKIIHALEAGAYAGAAFGPTDPQSLTKRIVDTAKKIDRIM